MADLGLAIAGVATTAAALSKALFALYNSARDAYQDADEIATSLDLFKAVLLELKRTLRKADGVCSEHAHTTIRRLLNACTKTFIKIEHLTSPLLPSGPSGKTKAGVKGRFAWHFKKNDVLVLVARLDSLKTMLHLMVSIISLAIRLPETPHGDQTQEVLSSKIRSSLCFAREHVANARTSLARLLVVEEQTLLQVPSVEAQAPPQFPRIATWLTEMVGLSESESTGLPSNVSTRSSIILSERYRSITGVESNDVEMLLEKWTTLSGLGSRGSQSLKEWSMKGPAKANLANLSNKGSSWENGGSQEPPTEFTDEDDSTTSTTSCDSASAETHDDRSDLLERTDSLRVAQKSDAPLPSHVSPSYPSVKIRKVSNNPSTEAPLRGLPVKASSAMCKGEQISEAASEAGTERPCKSQKFAQCSTEDDNDMPHEIEKMEPAYGQATKVREEIGVDQTTSFAYVEAWLLGQEVDVEALHPPQGAGPSGALFDFSILDPTISRAASTTDTLSSLGSVSDPRRIRKLIQRGNKSMQLGKNTEAFSLFREAYKMKDDLDSDGLCELEFRLGVMFARMNNCTMAEKVLAKALSRQRETNKDVKTVQTTEHFLCRILSRQRKWQQASKAYKFLWGKRRISITDGTSRASEKDMALRTGEEYSSILIELGEYEAAVRILEFIRPKAQEIRGIHDQKVVVRATLDLARGYRHLNKFIEAKEMLHSLHSKVVQAHGQRHALAATCNHEMAVIAYHEQNYKEAERLARMAAEIRASEMGRKHLDSIESFRYLALAQAKLGNLEEARSILEDIKPVAIDLLGHEHSCTIDLYLGLADILTLMEQNEDAETVLELAYRATHSSIGSADDETPATLRLSGVLGPLIIKNSSMIKEPTKRRTKLHRAATVYHSLYDGQKRLLGPDSEVSLQTGHDYGCLCMVQNLPHAEFVLNEVWSKRKKVLGETSPLAIQTGLQLGQAFFWGNKPNEAIAIIGSMHDLRMALSDAQCMQTIESAELLGFYRLSVSASRRDAQLAFDNLESAVEARSRLYGDRKATCEATLRLAALAASKGDFMKSHELFQWVFEKGGHDATAQGEPQFSNDWKTVSIWSGVSSSAMKFLQKEREMGNRILQRVVDQAAVDFGKHNLQSQRLAYLQACLLFMQRESRKSIAVLRRIYEQRKCHYGRQHGMSKAAGHVLALGVIANSILSGEAIPTEADKIHDWYIGTDGKSFLTTACEVMAMIFVLRNVESLAIPLFRWVYRCQKRRHGRFSKESLKILVIIHVVKAFRLGRKAANTSSNEGTQKDPRFIMRQLWDVTLQKTARRAGPESRLSINMSRAFAKEALWASFERELGIGLPTGATLSPTTFFSFIPGSEILERHSAWPPQFGDVLAITKGFARVAEKLDAKTDDTVSEVWTADSDSSVGTPPMSSKEFQGISEDLGKRIKGGRHASATEQQATYTRTRHSDDDNHSVSLSEFFDNDNAPAYSTFGASLLDLTALSDDDIQRAEDNMSKLQAELTIGVVSEADIDAARSNVDAMEKEAGVD